MPEQRYHYPGAVQVGIDIDRPTLDSRIEKRVELMWQQGLVEEVRRLVGHGLREGRTASRALGYQQVLAFLIRAQRRGVPLEELNALPERLAAVAGCMTVWWIQLAIRLVSGSTTLRPSIFACM